MPRERVPRRATQSILFLRVSLRRDLRGSPSTGKRVRVQDMSMKETMEQELAEALAMLEKANGALSRIFGIEEEGESE